MTQYHNDREPNMETCPLCGKTITEMEYIVNWASCAKCFDLHVTAYLDSPEGQASTQRAEEAFDEDIRPQ